MSFDTFDFRARTLPMIVVWFPVILTATLIAGGSPAIDRAWTLLPLPLVLVLTVLAAHLSRDAGKKIEGWLWASWGGPPTTSRMRWAAALNPILHQSLHADVQAVIGGQLRLPTEREEASDPVHADQVYETAVRSLIARTSSKDTYPKLKHDLVWYNFRRNLYGLKRFGYILNTVWALVSAGFGAIIIRTPIDFNLAVPIAALLLSIVTAVFLYCAVTPDWVRRSADAYAEELIKHAHIVAGGIDVE
ncbi:hypothetical protein HQP42_01440 [Rhodococcus fascians]|nr:hypothetical protein [Rhodococcus fascians]MBY3823736.1 hypothetical protein [Rhodococcus fascians]MBY3834258.1 hypothetical protein [Rhodococcus fascians]MBY3863471.1 hypothetical protein [Rhodococcus fascians]MBY3882941.1 hypothetical protein [Rhodococcus fascians]